MFPLDDNPLCFPPVTRADEDGFLAWGGDLSVPRLLLAYRSGIFPWYNEGEPIQWFCTSPRFVLFPANLKVSSSMRKVLRDRVFEITFNRAFAEVIRGCAAIRRPGQEGTWIGRDMIAAYEELHRRGFAWSAEAWRGGELAGGLYGVRLGDVFFGESMFARESNASKAAFISLVKMLQESGCVVIDCQMPTRHLQSLGAGFMPLADFLQVIDRHIPPFEKLLETAGPV